MAQTDTASCVTRDVQHGGKVVDIRHGRHEELESAGDYHEIGFDLTRIDAEDFLRVLREAGLVDPALADAELEGNGEYDPADDPHYREVDTRDGRYNFTWSNDDVLLVVGQNPFTGYRGKPERDAEHEELLDLPKRVDKVSYVGIEGREERVRSLANRLRSRAKHVKAVSNGERGYI